jgi:hypothetical protein
MDTVEYMYMPEGSGDPEFLWMNSVHFPARWGQIRQQMV